MLISNQVTNANEFGNSWVFEEIQACEDKCTDDKCDTGNACEEYPDRAIEAAQLCMYLNKDSMTGKSLKMEGCSANARITLNFYSGYDKRSPTLDASDH